MKTQKVVSVYKENPIDNSQDFYEVGKRKYNRESNPVCSKIEYHQPQGEGDQHYCDAFFDNETMKRIFRPDSISFEFIDPVVLPFDL